MVEKNGTRYVSIRLFISTIGCLIAVSSAIIGYVYMIAADGVDRARNNEVVIARIDTKLASISESMRKIEVSISTYINSTIR